MDQLEEKQLKVSRTFEAPLELLWQAWTDPEHFKKWYGPKGFSTPICEIDFNEGGSHFWSMKSSNGMQMYYSGIYKRIVPMESIVYSDTMTDENGNALDPSAMGMPEGSPASMDVSVIFSHEDGKTTVTVSHISSGPKDPAAMGWEQAFEKLGEVLAAG